MSALRHFPNTNLSTGSLCGLQRPEVVTLNNVNCPACLALEERMVAEKREKLQADIQAKAMAPEFAKIDEALERYSDVLQKIYDERTAGTYTFIGVLGDFLRQVQS
jgi:hypothetical protein